MITEIEKPKENPIIRSTKATLKFANTGKREQLKQFLEEYSKSEQFFITSLWKNKVSNPDFHIPSLLPSELTSQASAWLSARAIQCAAKQASGVVRSTIRRLGKMEYKQQELRSRGNYRQARKQQKKLDHLKNNGPTIKNVIAELDERFCEINLSSDNSFEIWLTLTSLGNKMKLVLPFKRNEHFNQMMKLGKINKGVRISAKDVTFIFELPEVKKVTEGIVVGIDIGMKNVYSTSNGQQSTKDLHGHDLDTIQDKLVRKKKGSRAFQRAQTHRLNYINMVLNRFNWNGIRRINIEKIRYLRHKSRTSRKLSHWTYTIIFDKVGMLAEETGVLSQEVNPAFTSRRCSQCGWVKKTNRKGKHFKCCNCGYAADADLNASVNISLDLSEVTKRDKQLYYSGKGFYWKVIEHEPIVRAA